MYKAEGKRLMFVRGYSDVTEAGVARDHEQAIRAADMLNRARVLNDVKRQYTNAARLIAQVEALPGFSWTEE